MQARSGKRIIRKFRPLPTSFRTNKPGYVIVENFEDADVICTLCRAELDFNRNACHIVDEIHEFPVS